MGSSTNCSRSNAWSLVPGGHEVCDWTGDRTLIIAYTPDCLGKLGQEDLEALHDYGFPKQILSYLSIMGVLNVKVIFRG